MDSLNWKSVSKKALIVFKSLNGLASQYLSSKFTSRPDTTPYTFRDSVNKLTVPLQRTNYVAIVSATVVLFSRIVFLKMQGKQNL